MARIAPAPAQTPSTAAITGWGQARMALTRSPVIRVKAMQVAHVHAGQRRDDLVHVAAGAEVAAGAGDHHRLDLAAVGQVAEEVAQLGVGVEGERVLPLGPVQGDEGDARFDRAGGSVWARSGLRRDQTAAQPVHQGRRLAASPPDPGPRRSGSPMPRAPQPSPRTGRGRRASQRHPIDAPVERVDLALGQPLAPAAARRGPWCCRRRPAGGGSARPWSGPRARRTGAPSGRTAPASRAEALAQPGADLALDRGDGANRRGTRSAAAPCRGVSAVGLGAHAVSPPSMGMAWPVTERAAGEQSQTTAAATSSGWTSRPCGLARTSSFSASSAERPVLADDVGDRAGDHVGVDEGRADGVDGDRRRLELVGQRPGQADQGVLGGGVGGGVGVALQPRDAGDVDDAAVLALGHGRKRRAGRTGRRRPR